MFVERGQGCNNHLDEERCLSYADGRGGRVGERCAWCCGENCNQQGGTGGDNKCEPVSFLQENGINRWRTAGVDNCTPPTTEPTITPTPSPSMTPTTMPTPRPTEVPTSEPTMMPTKMPIDMPTSERMAPSPGNAGKALTGTGVFAGAQCAQLMGQCGGEGATTNCCQEGTCVVLSPFVSQCRDLGGSKSESGVSMQTMLIAVFAAFLSALCCGTIVVYKLCIAGDNGSDSYHKHNSLSDRETRGGRYDDRHERRRKDKKKKSRSREDSRERSRKDRDRRTRRDSRTPKRTDSRGSSSWVEDN